LVVVEVAADSAAFTYRLDRAKLRQARSRDGRYLLRTNLAEEDPAKLWSLHLLLVMIEEAFKTLKSLPLRKQGWISRSGRSSTNSRRGSSSRLHCLLGLLPAGHLGPAPACAGDGADAA
jgi:hypothetical protein